MCLYRFQNYFQNGKGTGIKVVLFWGFITAFLTTFLFYQQLNTFSQRSVYHELINALPPIKIENGKIIEPLYDHQEITLFGKNGGQKIVLDTAQEDIHAIARNQILYVTARAIYIRHENRTYSIRFPADLSQVITPDILNQLFQLSLMLTAVFLSLFLFIIELIGFVFFLLIVNTLGPLFNKEISLDMWGRISSLPWAGMFALFLLSLFYWPLHVVYLFLIPLLITLIIGVRMKNSSFKINLEEENRNMFLAATKSIPFTLDEVPQQDKPEKKTEANPVTQTSLKTKPTGLKKNRPNSKKETLSTKKSRKTASKDSHTNQK